MKLGWADARDFFLARATGFLSIGGSPRPNGSEPQTGVNHVSDGGNKIGMMDLWVLKRMKEVGCADKKECPSGWEFEQGFRNGVAAFYTAVGI